MVRYSRARHNVMPIQAMAKSGRFSWQRRTCRAVQQPRTMREFHPPTAADDDDDDDDGGDAGAGAARIVEARREIISSASSSILISRRTQTEALAGSAR